MDPSNMNIVGNLTKIEGLIDGKKYEFILPSDAKLGEIHDALYCMKAFIISKIQEYHQKEVPEVKHDDEIVETPS